MAASDPPGAVRTACPYCGVGCGVLARSNGGGGFRVEGDPSHPANFGRLCSKGSALGETLALDERLLAPRLADGTEIGWAEATRMTAARFSEAISEHGPDSVAFYVSGQLLTEDYYVANKLMKGFIGSGNIDTNSRLCMASSVAAHKRAFGADVVPGVYEDLEQADLLVLTGSNLAWCHPVLFQRIAAAKAARPHMRVIVIDPRRTATTEIADQHLAIRPGSDVALWRGLLGEIARRGAVDAAFVARSVSGAKDAIQAALAAPKSRLLEQTGLSAADFGAFSEQWIGTRRVVSLWSQGLNQASDGADRVNAVINCHLATGRIGRPGMGPFSATGQPNAMGGREVGGLANMLACHLDIADATHRAAVADFWTAPRMASGPGLKAVDMFRAVAGGRIKALWVMATNPAASMPDADAVRDAIAACPFTVVSEATPASDTAKLADLLLPAAAWGEKSGTVTNSERRISRQRAFAPTPGAARPDWKIMCDVAAEMGWADAFAFESPAAIFREHAALSRVAAGLGSDFDLSGLTDLSDDDYDALKPVQWPVPAVGAPGGRFFAEGGFFTPDRRARMVALHESPLVDGASTDAPFAAALTPARPFRLNTGRVRDQWHTMTRTALAPRLNAHIAEPFVEIHPADAARLGVRPAELVRVEADSGGAILRALVTDRTPAGTLFAPMHWTARHASAGRIDALVRADVDPISGQPALKGAAASAAAWRPSWFGFAASRAEPEPNAAYWAKAPAEGGWRLEIADMAIPEDWTAFARDLLGVDRTCSDQQDGDPSMIETSVFADGALRRRIAFFDSGTLLGALFVAPEPVAVARAFVLSALEQHDAASPLALLAGRPGAGRPDPGPTVCACFGVGANDISRSARGGCASVAAIGAALQAGTNCGSCRPEIQALIDAADAATAQAAE